MEFHCGESLYCNMARFRYGDNSESSRPSKNNARVGSYRGGVDPFGLSPRIGFRVVLAPVVVP